MRILSKIKLDLQFQIRKILIMALNPWHSFVIFAMLLLIIILYEKVKILF